MLGPLASAVRAGLEERADDAKSGPMRAYMKSEMPYYGVPAPAQKVVFRASFKAHRLSDQAQWHETMLELWRGAACREERYGAIALSGVPRYRPWQTLDTLAVYEEMIVSGAWWDYTDSLSNRLGELLSDVGAPMRKKMVAWSAVSDIWKRRASIICQLKHRQQTDEALLFDNIGRSIGDSEFFIRKAIGWALRNYSRVAPERVVQFVADHDSLSPLSKKEALRLLN